MIVVELVESCDNGKNLTVTSDMFVVTSPKKNLYLFNGNFTVKENFPGPLTLVLTAFRCDMALINCENYHEFRFTSVCQQLPSNGAPWAPLVKSFHPEISCPMLEGIYTFCQWIYGFFAFERDTSFGRLSLVYLLQDLYGGKNSV